MHRLKIIKGKNEYTFDFKNTKILIGDNNKLKLDIYYQIKNYFLKINNSDYSIERFEKRILLFDEHPIDLKQWQFIDINPYFDIENDMKLGSKSLIFKHLNSFNEMIERSELYNTLSLLTTALNEEILGPETDLYFSNKKLELRLGEFSRPFMYKEITPSFKNDEFVCNSGDFDYEEIILLQLSLVNSIASKNKDNYLLCFCNIPVLTENIKDSLKKLKYDNLFIIINSNEFLESDFNDYCILSNRHYLDIANEEMVLDKMMDIPFHIEKEKFMKKIKAAIFEEKLDPNDLFNIEFFSYKL